MPRTSEQLDRIKEKTRAKILESALELFALRGFHGTSMQEIAKKAGVSKGLAYNYFKSKEEILKDILEQAKYIGDEIISEIFDEEDSFKQVQLLIEVTFKHITRHETYWRMFSALMLQPNVVDSFNFVDEFGTNLVEMTTKMLKKIGVKNPKFEALLLDASIDGVILHYLFFKDKYPLQRVKKELLKKYTKEELLKKINQ
ncbi:MAG: TetR/AcrR family transcriptional regulator [Ignavibacteria bacterium]|jgi:AcrR family transcriptional regulator